MVTPGWWQEETTAPAAVRWSGLLGRHALLAIAMSMLWLGVGAQAANAAAQIPAGSQTN